jgi:hypothetical protein
MPDRHGLPDPCRAYWKCGGELERYFCQSIFRSIEVDVMKTVLIISMLLIQGCGSVALPCRVTADVMRIVPIIGEPVAQVLDACGDIID